MNQNQINFVFYKLIEMGLTIKQAEIVKLVLSDLSTGEIAEKLFITEKTVKSHLTMIFKKLKIRNRISLILWSVRLLNEGGMVNDYVRLDNNVKPNDHFGANSKLVNEGK